LRKVLHLAHLGSVFRTTSINPIFVPSAFAVRCTIPLAGQLAEKKSRCVLLPAYRCGQLSLPVAKRERVKSQKVCFDASPRNLDASHPNCEPQPSTALLSSSENLLAGNSFTFALRGPRAPPDFPCASGKRRLHETFAPHQGIGLVHSLPLGTRRRPAQTRFAIRAIPPRASCSDARSFCAVFESTDRISPRQSSPVNRGYGNPGRLP
jgi:hypothetical protein